MKFLNLFSGFYCIFNYKMLAITDAVFYHTFNCKSNTHNNNNSLKIIYELPFNPKSKPPKSAHYHHRKLSEDRNAAIRACLKFLVLRVHVQHLSFTCMFCVTGRHRTERVRVFSEPHFTSIHSPFIIASI